MKKRDKIIYWVATGWLALGMLSGGIAQLIQVSGTTEGIARLGYPPYLLYMLGIWKILGVAAVLTPKFPVLKEWAYAGFFFAMTGALFSHFAMHDEAKEFFGPSLFIVLIAVSWYFNPYSYRNTNRKIVPVHS